jgi:hypothetical protein
MPYNPMLTKDACPVCTSEANIRRDAGGHFQDFVDCIRCEDFEITRAMASNPPIPYQDAKERALASYVIRKMQQSERRPKLTDDFFKQLFNQSLPGPAELMDNVIL